MLQLIVLPTSLGAAVLKLLPIAAWLVGLWLHKVTSKITLDYDNNIFRLDYLRFLFIKSEKEYPLQELEFEHEVGVNFLQFDTYSLDVFYQNKRIARLGGGSTGWDFERWKALRDEQEETKDKFGGRAKVKGPGYL